MTTQYALQLRPTQYLKDALDQTPTPWILAANQPANGLNITLAGWLDAADLPPMAEVVLALRSICTVLRQASKSTLWNVASDGRSRSVSLPQRGVQPNSLNSWFISLLRDQSSLGQIAAQLYFYPALACFRTVLFPTFQRTPASQFTDNLGAWVLEVAKNQGTYTRQEALAIRSRVIEDIDSWSLALVQRSNPGDLPQIPVLWPDKSALEASEAVLYRPLLNLLPQSIYTNDEG